MSSLQQIEAVIPIIAAVRTPRWYAVYTRSKFEKRVATELTERGIIAYLPVISEVHQWQDRRKQVAVPVFPGYLFARFCDTAEERLRVLRIGGTVRILGNGSLIDPVSDGEIESIRRLIDSKCGFALHPYLHEGVRVRVKRGPLRGVEGLFVRIKNRDRLVVSIQLLSQSVATEVDSRNLEALPARAAAGREN
jgi:transcriptional antiterminator NusG